MLYKLKRLLLIKFLHAFLPFAFIVSDSVKKKKNKGKSFTTNHPPVPLKPIKVTHEFERIVFGLYCVQDLICCTLKALH